MTDTGGKRKLSASVDKAASAALTAKRKLSAAADKAASAALTAKRAHMSSHIGRTSPSSSASSAATSAGAGEFAGAADPACYAEPAGGAADPSDGLLLHTGARMPVVQLGTYKMKGVECREACRSALRLGYRGVDTASVYDNEEEVGKAIRESGVSRDELFVQTKLWRSFTGTDPKTGRPRCDAQLRKSLRKLGLDAVDVWLMHWPGPGRYLNYPPVRSGMTRPKMLLPANEHKIVPADWMPATRLETYAHMARHVGKGVHALGVCNFSARQLDELLAFCAAHALPRPVVVQNECHPLLKAESVRRTCRREGIVFQAYASLGAGALGLLDLPAVVKIAEKRGATPAQVLLAWAARQGMAVLPKSAKPHRQKENLQIEALRLHSSDMDALNSLESKRPRGAGAAAALSASDALNSRASEQQKRAQEQNTMVGWLREHDPDHY